MVSRYSMAVQGIRASKNPRQVTGEGRTMLSSRPVDREEEELMDPGSWDDDSLEVRRPVKKPRAIVSVAFPSADFELIVAKAREQGATVSGYIRQAALSQAKSSVTSVSWSATHPVHSAQGSVFATTLIDAPAEQVERAL